MEQWRKYLAEDVSEATDDEEEDRRAHERVDHRHRGAGQRRVHEWDLERQGEEVAD